MEDTMKQKEDKMNSLLDAERDRATAASVERKEWDEVRRDLEDRLAQAQNLNDSLRQELDRLRDDHALEIRDLREQLEDARESAAASGSNNMALGSSQGLQLENDELRVALR